MTGYIHDPWHETSLTPKELDVGMVEETHPSYDIFQLFFAPGNAGHQGTARDRTYLIMSHQEMSSCVYDPETMKNKVSKRMHSKVRTVPSDYFIGTVVEVQREAEQLAIRRKIPYRPRQLDLSYLLTGREVTALHNYEEAYRNGHQRRAADDPNLVLFLGDNGTAWKTWSAGKNRIPTFRRNAKTGLFWIPSLNRFLLSREKLACMGFPLSEQMCRFMHCPPMPSQDVVERLI